MSTRKQSIDATWLETHEWMLRASDNGTSYGGFRWKQKRAWNRCPNWTTTPTCESGGLFGIAPEAYSFGLACRPRIELHETRGERVIVGGNKIKVPESRIVAIGADIPDAAFRQSGIRVLQDGEYVTEINRGIWLLLEGRALVETVSGGDVRSYDDSRRRIGNNTLEQG